MTRTKLCIGCMRWFQTRRSRQLYCSGDCKRIIRMEIDRKEAREKKRASGSKPMDRRTCNVCGNRYMPKSFNQKTCGSDDCKLKWECRRLGVPLDSKQKTFYASQRLDSIVRPQKWYPLAPNTGLVDCLGGGQWVREYGQGLVNYA